MKQAVTYFLVAASGGGSSYVTNERKRERASCQKILCSSRVARSRLDRCAMLLTAKRARAEEILTMKARTEEEEEKMKKEEIAM